MAANYKISDMVRDLQEIQAREGDLPVVTQIVVGWGHAVKFVPITAVHSGVLDYDENMPIHSKFQALKDGEKSNVVRVYYAY
jgi:hypothetical protein